MKIALFLSACLLSACFHVTVVPQPTASGEDTAVYEGNACPQGHSFVTKRIVKRRTDQVCAKLGRWFIARIAGGGSLSGRGYDCGFKKTDDRGLGHSLCTRIVKVTGDLRQNPDVCPPGKVSASRGEVMRNPQTFCSQLDTWDIARIAGGGSLSGPGYNCDAKKTDPRPLGHRLCQ